jgi:hypothetical protein
MTVEELYWKLKAIRDSGHSSEKIVICAYDDNGDEHVASIDDVVPEETPVRGKWVVIVGGDEL